MARAKTKEQDIKQVSELATSSTKDAILITRNNHASATGSNYLTYRNIVPDISVKNSYSEKDYYNFREDESLPTTPKGIMAMGMSFYKKNPIVKNTFDMMAEFAANGMYLAHRSERMQDFYTNWLQKVGSYSINEQFVRLLLKAGNTVINRSFTKVKKAQIRELQVGLAEDQEFPSIEFVKSEVPISYSFLNPLDVFIPQEEIAMFKGGRTFFLQLPEALQRAVKKMTKKELAAFANEFPPEIADAIKAGKTEVPLDPFKVSIFHYKKDDFEPWGEPVHACILDDLVHYEKVKLADRTTLDSIASQIRVWRLGHIEKDFSFFPGPDAYEKLQDILSTVPSGGIADIIWNKAIDVLELSKEAYKFLDMEKYKAPLNAIYQGLGVPRTVNDDNSFNNNYFGLKTMVERLNYARNMLKDFWTNEFKMLHKAFGLPGEPPTVMFDEISITNREQMLALVRDLVDRNVISHEECQRLFNTVPDVENYRIKKETRRRENGSTPAKAGPYHNANNKAELEKIALQKGITMPKDLGVETSLNDKQIMSIVKPKPPKGQPGQGRPKNAADKGVRKKRKTKPRSAMSQVWYVNAEQEIRDILLAKSLEKNGKKNQRQLSTAETDRVENEKFAMLYNIPFGTTINQEALNGVSTLVEQKVLDDYNHLNASFVKMFGRQPNITEKRILQIDVCMRKELEQKALEIQPVKPIIK